MVDINTRLVLAQVLRERERQDEKWGEQNHPDAEPTYWNHQNLTLAEWHNIYSNADQAREQLEFAVQEGTTNWLHIFMEELHEAIEEIESGDVAALREELIQVAAVAISWVEAIDRREKGNEETSVSSVS